MLARGVRGYKRLKVRVERREIIDARVSAIIRSAKRLIIFLSHIVKNLQKPNLKSTKCQIYLQNQISNRLNAKYIYKTKSQIH